MNHELRSINTNLINHLQECTKESDNKFVDNEVLVLAECQEIQRATDILENQPQTFIDAIHCVIMLLRRFGN